MYIYIITYPLILVLRLKKDLVSRGQVATLKIYSDKSIILNFSNFTLFKLIAGRPFLLKMKKKLFMIKNVSRIILLTCIIKSRI